MLTAEGVRAWLAEVLPDRAVTSVRRLGQGLDNVAWLVDDAVVVRVAKAGSEQPRREAAVLEVVSRVSPIPTPRVVASPDRGILVCVYLAGRSLLDNATELPRTETKRLGHFLAAIHAVPADHLAQLVEVDDTSPQQWLDEARAQWPGVRATVPPESVAQVEAFLSAPPPSFTRQRVLCHNDLGSEHLLVGADGRITGIIDWSDAALADPAIDFSRLCRDYGLDIAIDVRDHYALDLGDDALERMMFYGRCSLIEDLAFARETNDDRYRRGAMRSLLHLFGGPLTTTV